jgi:hypothetical protein
MKNKLLIAFGVVALLCSIAWGQRTRPAPPIRWEYTAAQNASVDALNNFGKEGWELIQIVPDKAGDRPDAQGGWYYFRRPR